MACGDYTYYIEAIEQLAIRDAGLCPFQTTIGGPEFAAMVMLGMINLPLYVTQGILGPFVITMIISGIVFTQMSTMAQGIAMVGILFVVGLGPIIAYRRFQR